MHVSGVACLRARFARILPSRLPYRVASLHAENCLRVRIATCTKMKTLLENLHLHLNLYIRMATCTTIIENTSIAPRKMRI